MTRNAKSLLIAGITLIVLSGWHVPGTLTITVNSGGGFQRLLMPDEERNKFFWFEFWGTLTLLSFALGLLLLAASGVAQLLSKWRRRYQVRRLPEGPPSGGMPFGS
jgi:hypothetical protein